MKAPERIYVHQIVKELAGEFGGYNHITVSALPRYPEDVEYIRADLVPDSGEQECGNGCECDSCRDIEGFNPAGLGSYQDRGEQEVQGECVCYKCDAPVAKHQKWCRSCIEAATKPGEV